VNSKISKADGPLLVSAFALTLGGLIMIYSGSSVIAYGEFADSAYYFKKQLIWATAGLIAGLYIYVYGADKIRRFIPALLAAALFLMFAVHFPGLGRRAGGAVRWLKAGPVTFQPFEFLKLCYVLYLALIFSSEKLPDSVKLTRGMIITAISLAALVWQKDLGGAVIIAVLFLFMLVVAGFNLKYLLMFIPVMAAGFVYFIKAEPYRVKRIFTFLDPWQDPLGAGWQTIQSLIAIGSGGIFGVGFFESQQKFYYLPTPHTDYIFSIIGEELGLWGSLLVLIGFFFILQRGIFIALNTRDTFLKYAAAGATFMIVVQALANMYVATGLMPPKGTTLPFMSAGGSSLIVNIAAIAILLSISRRMKAGSA